MRPFFAIFFLLSVAIQLHASKRTFRLELAVNEEISPENLITVQAGQEFDLKIRIFELPEDKLITKYKMMHMKAMHMVVAKKDLKTLSHVHPTLDMMKGEFKISMNQPTDDPDNQDLPQILSEPGLYTAYIEFSPKEGVTSPLPESSYFQIRVLGETNYTPPQEDPLSSKGTIVKFFNQDGTKGEFGSKYRITLERVVHPGCDGNLIEFLIHLEEYKVRPNPMGDPIEGYIAIYELEPWLMMHGHALILPEVQNYENIYFEHMHAMKLFDSNTLKFFVFDRKRLYRGINKLWVQMRHEGIVQTFHFTFDHKYVEPRTQNCQ